MSLRPVTRRTIDVEQVVAAGSSGGADTPMAEKDSLVIPDDAKALELGMQLQNIGDFFDDAANDEKNRILHLLFEAIFYEFEQKQVVRFKPPSEYAPVFRLAPPLSGWIENEGLIFSTFG